MMMLFLVFAKLPIIVPLFFMPILCIIIAFFWKKDILSSGLWASIIFSLFFFIDLILLMLLPKLKLSYGPVGFPLLGITLVKFILTVFIAVIFNIIIALNKKTTKINKKYIGLIILAFFNCFILSLETYGLYIEPFKVEVSNLKIATKKLKLDRPIKIAQISDLHIERTTKRELRVLNKIKEINPDIIVLTGDYLNISFTHDPQTLIQTREFLMNLKAPFGVYAVTSDIVDPDETVDILFSGLNIEVLEDKIYPVKIYGNIIYIIGVSNIDSLLDKLTLLSLVNKLPDESYKLFLYHTPDLIEAAAASKIDLYLAGHTHGGQIRLPFYGALITCSTFKKKYEQGLFEILDTKMYVSRGLGMEGQGAPRVRFLCPPEIAIFDIKSE